MYVHFKLADLCIDWYIPFKYDDNPLARAFFFV